MLSNPWPRNVSVYFVMSSLISAFILFSQVDVINDHGTFTEIAYTLLPLETRGCPPSPQLIQPSLFRMKPNPHRTTTLYKQGRKDPPPPQVEIMTPPERDMPQRVVQPEATNHTHQRPLVNICDVMPRVAAALNSSLDGYLSCWYSPPPSCSHIHCASEDAGENVRIAFMPCSTPPSLHLTVSNGDDIVLTNLSVAHSRVVNVDLVNITVPLNFTVRQHTEFLTMGIQV